ncbi:MAG: flagellin [Alphaproteobacteria bacterium]|nr:flagellin [Alphaproteobacteria bacterium]
MDGVSTYGLDRMVLDAATRLQTAVAAKEVQEASGLVGQTYGALGSESGNLINLQNQVSQMQSLSSAASTASNRAQAMYTAVGDMITMLTSLRSSISSAISSSDNSTLASEAQGTLSDLANAMNTEQGGTYLFSGSRTDTAPVDVSDPPYASSTDPTTASTSYYQGDDSKAAVQLSDEDSITYGVTADNPAFEEALRVANVVANVSSSDSTTLKEAYDLATTALTALADVQGQLSISSARLDEAQQEQTSSLSLLQTMVSNITSVDVAQVTAQVSTYQAQLEASYSAVAAVAKIHLANYL